MSTTTEIENEERTCSRCAAKYIHEPLIIGSTDMLSHVTTCEPCSAILEKQEARQKWEDEAKNRFEQCVPAEYRKTSTEYPNFPKHDLNECLAWMKGGKVNGSENKPFLGLIGESGRSKTRVISVLAKHLIWRGEFVTWVNSSQFQWCCQNQFNDCHTKEAQRHLKTYRESKNLVFDDIGSLKSTETVSDNLYSLLEHRTANGLRMMWTSNETLEEILAGKGLTEKARARNISRLGGFSNMIEL